MEEDQIRFSPKRVDESWKESVSKEKGKPATDSEDSRVSFLTFVTSLGVQAMIHLGMLEGPEGAKPQINLEAAGEMIDVLLMLKEKTANNRTPQEEKQLNSLIADLQIKFVQTQNQSQGDRRLF